jgi:hypothetical protein
MDFGQKRIGRGTSEGKTPSQTQGKQPTANISPATTNVTAAGGICSD